MNGAAYANFDNQEHVLKLGETFEKQPKSAFHTVRYDFKPASIDTACEGELEVGKGEQVTITLPNLEGSTAPVTVFKGSKRPYMKECILIVNHDTGEYRLEKLNSNIAVKKTRAEGSSKVQSRLEQQTSRLSQQMRSGSGASSSSSSSSKAPPGFKNSPPKDKMSPGSPMDDIERELMAEARVMDQMSSGDSSSESRSSSSSSENSSSSSSDSEDETQPRPAGAPSGPAHSTPAVVAASHSRSEEASGHFMSTLKNDLQLSYFQTTHQLQIEHSKIYGPLWKSKYGPLVIVNVASADLIEQVLRQEGHHPIRTDMPHWRGYRQLRKHSYGPLTEMGAEWQRIRRILNPRMLKPKHVSTYTGSLNEVVTDFIKRVDWLRETKGGGVMVHDLAGELYKFAFEGISAVLFETRMGCLNDEVPEETQKFITSVGEMFRLSPIILLFPRSLWPYLPFWKHFVALWDHLFKVAQELVEQKTAEIQEKVNRGEPVAGEYLTHLLVSEQMSISEVLGSITELLLAGVDTTSNTISWALYHLAREPDIQEKLHREVIGVCPGDTVPTSDDIARMPWLKAVVKETLRLYPVVPGNARITAENEIVVGDYIFPKNTLFHLCHYAVSYEEKNFPRPHAFQPERWLRGSPERQRQHPFSSVPFGFGIRACLGKRVAELEMYLILSRLMKHFEVRPDPSGTTVKPITRTLLVPATLMSLQFLDRRGRQDSTSASRADPV
ncbi:hypothetical protein AAFF_G00288180 [Aldrovandia affinis]|uniref:Transcription elongation factor Eaf N-terminal domain-containing protein n=1 Tax=Aldrovandia affinis TaxID=143900 RepID=A0AAD7WS16_9TELE|nr:hypothetical protein AAFF_G00288180 [Aldrovandia affinis]